MALITKPNFTYVWASGGDVVAPNDAKKQLGWVAEAPPFQYDNWLQNRQDQMLAHINQRGIPAWDGLTNYEAGGLSYVQGSDGKVYKSVAASGPSTTVQDPTTDVTDTYWTVAFADVGAFLTQAAGDTRYAQRSNNLSDLTNASTARTNLGAAPLASPAFTGTPTTPTAATATNTTQIASTAFVQAQIASSVPAASETVAGRVELATNAEVNALTDDQRAVTPLKLGNGIAFSNGVVSYRKTPDWLDGGTIEAWGSGVTSGTGRIVVTLPLAMANTDFVVMLSGKGTGAGFSGWASEVNTASRTTSTFEVGTFTSSAAVAPSIPFQWRVIGKAS